MTEEVLRLRPAKWDFAQDDGRKMRIGFLRRPLFFSFYR
jgi:hypothetical protein